MVSARKVSLHSRRFPLASHVLGKESGREREKRKGLESYASSLNSSGRGRRGEIHFQVATDERTTHGPVSSLPSPSFTRKIGPLIPVAGIAIEFSPNCAGQTRDPTLWWHADSQLWCLSLWNFRFSWSRLSLKWEGDWLRRIDHWNYHNFITILRVSRNTLELRNVSFIYIYIQYFVRFLKSWISFLSFFFL